MKLNRNRLKKLIKEAIISAMDPIEAKKIAINLFRSLDQKLKSDPNMISYYDRLYEFYKDILVDFSVNSSAIYHIPDTTWEHSNYGLLLIESLLMRFPEDQEYKTLIRELNEMYDVFYRSESGGYDEYYEREDEIEASRYGLLLNDFLLGDIEKLAAAYPEFVQPIGEDAADNPSQFDKYQYKEMQSFANELGILLDDLVIIPSEIMAEDYRNHLYNQISRELSRNKTGMFSEHPLQSQSLKSNSQITASRYHAQTSRGVLPLLVVADSMSSGYSNIYLPSSLEAIANSYEDSEDT